MLVLINLFRELVLLLVENLAIGAGQFAVVLTAHQLFFFVEIRFFLLEIGGFSGGQLAAGHAVRDAVLLVFFALVDGGRRIRRVRILGHRGQHQGRQGCAAQYDAGIDLHGYLLCRF